MSIVLTLPWPPSTNTYYRRGKYATYLSPKGREFKAAVADLISSLAVGIGEPLKTRLSVYIGLSAPSKRTLDIDNRAKAILDSLQDAGVIEDDSQIDHLTLIRMPVSKGGYASVVIVEE